MKKDCESGINLCLSVFHSKNRGKNTKCRCSPPSVLSNIDLSGFFLLVNSLYLKCYMWSLHGGFSLQSENTTNLFPPFNPVVLATLPKHELGLQAMWLIISSYG